ncbi:hypothetical protein D3C73_1477310 [compost metagenome]
MAFQGGNTFDKGLDRHHLVQRLMIGFTLKGLSDAVSGECAQRVRAAQRGVKEDVTPVDVIAKSWPVFRLIYV